MQLKFLLFLWSWGVFQVSLAQQTNKVNIYNPLANAAKDIDSVLAKATVEKKQVLIQIGGNWCIWCIRLQEFIAKNLDVKRKIDMDYITYHLNYSTENTNEALLLKYRHPERFGFPVLLVLDAGGNLLHTQDTGLLEENSSYSKVKIYDFLKNWTIRAVEGKN